MVKPRAPRGYTLVALTIAITIMLIMIAAVLPLASTQQQREKEEELIFRGKQYAEGVRCFRRKYGRYPTTLKEMIETKPRTLRKLWKDPITNSNDWGIVTLGTLNPVGGGSTDGGLGKGGTSTSGGTGWGSSTSGGGFGGTSTSGGSSFGGGGYVSTDGGKAGGGGFGGGSSSGGMFGGGGSSTSGGSGFGGSSTSGGRGFGGPASGETPLMPVMGVFSKSKKKAFRVFLGRDVYDEWKFTEATLLQSGADPGFNPGAIGPGIGGGPVGPAPGGGGGRGGKK